MSRIKKAFSKAWQENHNAQLESKKLEKILEITSKQDKLNLINIL